MKIGIIGGGIIGLSSAYYLQKEGHDVTMLDQGDMSAGCSVGNAGMIVPSHFIPLAAPGMISKGIKWMFNSKSPFFVRPRVSLDLFKWGYQFYKHATAEHVERSAPALKELSLLSKSLYREWSKTLPFDFGYQERGLLMLYKSKDVEKEERETAYMANRMGIEAQVLDEKGVQALEPDVAVDVLGGVYFPGDAHLIPQKLIKGLIAYLKERNVKILTHTAVEDFEIRNHTIASVKTKSEEFAFDEVILASGSWSSAVSRKLHIHLPLQAGKGYSFTINDVVKNVRVPSIFLEARVAVTPMGNSLRFGGTMEIAGINHSINMNRVNGIVESIARYYPEMKVATPSAGEVWHGLRPCSPDGLPFIGRSEKIQNLVIATGHSMMGISLAPATGILVRELIQNQKLSTDVIPFRPERF